MNKDQVDLLALLEQQVGQDRMVPLALQETLDHQVLDMQDYLVLKVTLVLLDLKVFQGV